MHLEPIDFLGVAGAGFILFAFYRTSIGKWTGKSIWYELDNLIGGSFMVIYAFSKSAYISIFLNGVWLFVGFRGVSSYAERRVLKKAERRVKRVVRKETNKIRRRRHRRK